MGHDGSAAGSGFVHSCTVGKRALCGERAACESEGSMVGSGEVECERGREAGSLYRIMKIVLYCGRYMWGAVTDRTAQKSAYKRGACLPSPFQCVGGSVRTRWKNAAMRRRSVVCRPHVFCASCDTDSVLSGARLLSLVGGGGCRR